MSLQKIKLVTFDATNTLLNFKVAPWQYYAKVANDYGSTAKGNELKNPLLKSYKKMWNEHPNFGRESVKWQEWWKQVVKYTFENVLSTDKNIEQLAEILINDFKTSKCWYTVNNCDKLLNMLKERNIDVGIITNFDPRIHDILNNLHLSHHFNFIASSYEIGFTKPNKAIFERTLNKYAKKVDPSQTLHIGDDIEKDYKGAKGAGWNAILVNDKTLPEELPNKSHLYRSLDCLANAIKNDILEF